MSIKVEGSEKAMESLAKVIEVFQEQTIGDVIAAGRIAAAAAEHENLPSSGWSMRNRMLAYLQGGSLDCRGARQWKQAGRLIKKGGSAVYIWKPLGFTVQDEESDEERWVLRGFKAIPVFPIHMTRPMSKDEAEAAGVEFVDYTPAELPPLAELADRFGLTVEWWPLRDVTLGWYHDQSKHIMVGTEGGRDGHHTWFHELGHAVHAEVLQRRGEKLGQVSDAKAEAVADVVACVLADLYGGVDLTGSTWEYLKIYAGDADSRDASPEEVLGLIGAMMTDICEVLEVIHGGDSE